MNLQKDETIVSRLITVYYVVKNPANSKYLAESDNWVADREDACFYQSNVVFTHAQESGGVVVMVSESL